MPVQATGEHLGIDRWRIKNINKSPTCENLGLPQTWFKNKVISTNHYAHLNMLKLDMGKELDQ